MQKIRNAYESEKERLLNKQAREALVMMEIASILDEHGYMLEAELVHGEPYIVLTKVDYE